MKVEGVHTTPLDSALPSKMTEGKSNGHAITFGAAKRGGARRLFTARGDIIRGTVESDAGRPRAILRMISDCY